MSEQTRPEKPEPWSQRRKDVARIPKPVAYFNWLFDWVDYCLANISFFSVLATLGSLSVLIAIITYLVEIPQRETATRLAAWGVITSASGKPGDLGRGEAIKTLARASHQLEQINLSRAVLPGLKLPDCTSLYGANLTNASFSTDALEGSKSKFATKIVRAKLRGATLTKTNFKNADLSYTDFSDAHITETFFVGANLTGAIFSQSRIVNANFKGANLSRARLENLDLSHAFGLTPEQVLSACFDTSTKLPVPLRNLKSSFNEKECPPPVKMEVLYAKTGTKEYHCPVFSVNHYNPN